MRYTLTEHARDAIHKRGIAIEWLERALDTPQWRVPDELDAALEHRLAVIPEFGGRVLRVIVNTTAEPERVITAYFDRAALRALRGER
jgi:hypothetical protein